MALHARRFSRGVAGVSEEKRRAWSAIYAEGHARDEANPLAVSVLSAGWQQLRAGKTAEGEAAIREAMQLDPSYAAPHTLLGELYLSRGQLEAAAAELRAAKSLDFQQVDARTDLGFVYVRLGRDEEALWEFRELVRLDPKLTRAHLGLGMALVRLDKLDARSMPTERRSGSTRRMSRPSMREPAPSAERAPTRRRSRISTRPSCWSPAIRVSGTAAVSPARLPGERGKRWRTAMSHCGSSPSPLPPSSSAASSI